jgi:hypothetical protein
MRRAAWRLDGGERVISPNPPVIDASRIEYAGCAVRVKFCFKVLAKA